ncbi:methyl-accepting chemotaxis protein [Roseibium sp.]|uniref:methyl-accepting chemotaxis protein n=1 Tax=Roseibium sp. TaxID=1936156 RepID=UPI003A96CD14
MFSLLGKMRITQAMALAIGCFMALAMLAIGGIVYNVASRQAEEQAVSKQNTSLRVAATYLSGYIDGMSVEWAADGNVSRITMDALPEFSSHELIDSVGAMTGETATIFLWDEETRDFWRKTTNIVKPDGNRAVGTPLGQKGAVYPVVMKGETFKGSATILGTDYYTIYAPIYSASNSIVGILYAGVEQAAIHANVTELMTNFMLLTLPVVLIAIALALFVTTRLLRPLSSLAASAVGISEDRLDDEVEHTGRSDQIGVIARAVETLREKQFERRTLSGQQADNEAHALNRQQRVQDMISKFHQRATELLRSVSETAGGLEDTARSLSGIAQQSTQGAEATLVESDAATGNAQAVAGAAEELAASIGEISRQVAQTTEVVDRATQGTRHTNEKVEGLAASASKIGEVVTLIQAIAEQTNLLALNATIEAARAGEAGKGFAVVAAEVKELATQTSKATEEISAQISAIQDATKQSVQAIAEITDIMDEVNQYTATIAAAVEEQGGATNEISQNIQRAAQGTQSVSANIQQLTGSVAQTSNSADIVLSASGELNQRTETLREEVEVFLKDVAAA